MIWQDIAYSLRTARRRPAFVAIAVLILALAIGGNTAMFTVVHAVLLRPLPYPDSDRLVQISGGATPIRLSELKASARSFSDVGAYTGGESPTISGGQGEPEVLKGARVSANFLRILKVEPLLGRPFRSTEDAAGGPAVVMISARLWQRRFAGDPNIVGKSTTLAGTPYTIIGVLPPKFLFPFSDLDLWVTAPAEFPLIPPPSRALSPFLTIFGRLKPGVTEAAANAEAKVIHQAYAKAHPAMLDAKPKRPDGVRPMKDTLVADVRSMLWMLVGAVSFVLLISCANLAGLLLAQALARTRELALRAALGASRWRLAVQLVSESLLLALSGGVLGFFLAIWMLGAIPGLTALDLPRAQEVHLDWVVLGFAAALSMGTGLLFGLVPALGASRPDLMGVLRASGEASNQGGSRRFLPGLSVRGILLTGQVALSIVLLIGAALLIQSLGRLRGVALGFNPSHLLTASVSLPPTQYQDKRKTALYFQNLLARIDSIPGVRSAAASMFLPMTGYAGTPIQDAAKPLLRLNERPIAVVSVVTPGYFRTLAIPLRRGRDFNERDKEGAPGVAIIDERLARKFWPSYPQGLDPVGQHLWVGGVSPKPAEIIGIAADVHQNVENTAWPQTVYVAFEQGAPNFAMLAIRTAAQPLSFATPVREQVRASDRNQSISDVRTMDMLVDEQMGQRRLLMILLTSFAGMAVALVLMGLYGIIAYSVTQRTPELGVRRALGAQHGDILRLVVGQSLRLTVAGIALGIGGAFMLTRLMQGFLFQVSATDPATFIAVALLFLCVALLASYLPARRATGIDPVSALRI